MGTLIKFLTRRAGIIIGILLSFAMARGYSQSCEVTLRNDTLIDANNLLVDIYVRSTSGTFYYSSGQYKITFNKASILNGGVITGSVVSGSSELTNSAQIPVTVNTDASTYWRVVAELPPSTQAACSQISSTGYGTRICRVQLTNTEPFGKYRPDNLIVSTTPNATAVFYALSDGTGALAASTLLNDNLINPVLNGDITVYNVTGDATEPATITVSSSQSDGVVYILHRDGVAVSSAEGDGSPVLFTGQPAGTYTVTARRAGTYLTASMNGTVVVSEACTPVSVTSSPSGSTICAGGSASMSVVVDGTPPFTYQWQYNNSGTWVNVVNGTPSGAIYTNAATATLGISGTIPAGSYQFQCYVTNCSASQNATSASATLTVLPTPTATITGTATVCQGTASPDVTFNNPQALPVTITYNINGSNPTTVDVPANSSASVSVSTASAGTFNYNLVNVVYQSAPNCSTPVSGTATVTVRPTPTASVSGTASVCLNAPSPDIVFTNPQSLPITVTYDINGGTEASIQVNASSTASLTVSTSTVGSFTYNLVSVSYQSAPSCPNNAVTGSATITVTALPQQPTITADGPTEFCLGEDVVLTAPLSDSYLWSNGATSRSITVDASGSFSVQVTNAAGCQSVPSPTVVVTVNPLPSRPNINPAGSVTICAGTSQTLTSTAGIEYLWSTGETSQSITVNTSGSYTVQVTNTYGCYSPASLPTTVTVSPLPETPTITPSGSVAICAGGSTTLTSSPSAAYLWSNGATTRSINVNSAGSYTVRVTDANGCQSLPSAATTVTVNPLPSPPSIGTITQPTCAVQTGSVVLGGLPAGSWTVNPGGITGSTSTVTVAGLTAGSHTFTVTNSNGCTSGESAPVVINTPPAVPTAPDVGTVTQPTCAISTGSIGFSGLPSTGVWTLIRNPGGITAATGSVTSYTLTEVPSGTWTFTVTNDDGCVSPATAPVTISDPLPIPPAPVVSVDCSSGAGNAVITVTTPTGTGYQYRLDAGAYQTSNVFTSVSNGDHSVTVQNASGCTTTGPIFSVNCGCANPPTVTLSATSGSTCGTTAVTVSGNTFGGGATSVTITENGGGTVTPTSSTSSPFTFTYTPVAADAGRTLVITVTTDNPAGTPCTAASATYTLTVNANPPAPIPGTITQPSCSLPTGSVILNNLPASGEWTVTVTPGGRTVTGTGSSTSVSGLVPGTYSFTVTNALGCVSGSSTSVIINAQPDTPSAPVIGTITQPTCGTSTGSVSLSGLPATGTWTVTRTPGNVSVTGSGTTRTIGSINPGTYTFTVTNAAGCISPASEAVVINPQPVTPPTPVVGTITHPTCEVSTGSVVLEGLPETGEWILTRFPGSTTSTGSGSSATISSLAPGTYNFSVTNAEGCTSPVSGNVVINLQPPTPNPPVIGTITHPTFTVATGSVVLTGLPSTGTWTLTRYPDGFTSEGTGTTRTVSGLEPGTYTFTVTNAVGCTSATSAGVTINARPGAPVVVINTPPNICENQTTDLTLPAVTAGSDANLTFTYWTDVAATIPYATPETAPAGTYWIRGTSTAGYWTIKEVVVTADVIPAANAGPDQVLDYIFGTTLNAEIPEIGTGMWALVTGDGEIFNSTAPSTAVNGLALGENVFGWSVTNGACDPVTDYIVVTVNNLIIPTLITPNQDGRNDFFVLRGLQTLGRTELAIFDRRGLKVYENTDYDNTWEGLDYNGYPLPEDTYFYVVRAANGISLSGYIVVRR